MANTNTPPALRRVYGRMGAIALHKKYTRQEVAAFLSKARQAQQDKLWATYIPDADQIDPDTLSALKREVMSRRMKAVRRARTQKARAAKANVEAPR
jgi:hypothetical protein